MASIIHHAKTHRRKIGALGAIILISAAIYLIYFRYFGVLPQPTIFLFQDMPKPTPTDVVMVFSPHQDDETLGTGGYMSDAVAAGAKVIVVFATDGNRHHLKVTRHAEALAATEIVGVPNQNNIFYDYPDGQLKTHTEALDQSLATTINQYKPTVVMVTDPVDIHPDHSVLGAEVKKEVAANDPSASFYTYIIHFREYPRPQQFKPHDYLLPPTSLITQNRQWLKYTLSQTAFDKKNEAVLQYKSQLRTPFLHSLMLSFVRQNEMFSKETP